MGVARNQEFSIPSRRTPSAAPEAPPSTDQAPPISAVVGSARIGGYYGDAGEVLRILLRAERKKAGLTQEQLAQRAGVSQELISRGERGLRRLTLCQMRDLCLAMDVDFVQFVARLHAQL